MPEMLTCSRCGVRTQVLDGGRPRCWGCGNVLMVGAAPAEPDSYAVVEEEPPAEGDGPDPRGSPLCPGCHRPTGHREPDCRHCGYQFGPDGGDLNRRRDSLPHRGGVISRVGAAALIAGGSAVLTGPLGMVFALLLGVTACWMAADDLPRMRTGEIDPAGRAGTELGGAMAAIGIGLGVILGSACVAYWLNRLG